jgi:hypothetical protein
MAALVTSKGREMIVARLQGAPGAGTEFKNIGWGTNPVPTTAAVTDVAPFTEAAEARVVGTSSTVTTTTTNDTYQVVGTITASAGRTIQEVFLSDSTTKPSAAAVAAGGVVGSSVSTTLNTSATFTPGNNNFIQIRGEVMQVTAGSGSTALTVVRAQNGSAAIATITAADAVQPGNPPGQTGITGGSVAVHADHGTVVLANGDSIAYTIQVKFT